MLLSSEEDAHEEAILVDEVVLGGDVEVNLGKVGILVHAETTQERSELEADGAPDAIVGNDGLRYHQKV
jgi:hypothetical protein